MVIVNHMHTGRVNLLIRFWIQRLDQNFAMALVGLVPDTST